MLGQIFVLIFKCLTNRKSGFIFQSCIPVDVMPGVYDPTNQFLPQQPLHKCMLPSAFSYSTIQSVTNPYEAKMGGLRLVYLKKGTILFPPCINIFRSLLHLLLWREHNFQRAILLVLTRIVCLYACLLEGA